MPAAIAIPAILGAAGVGASIFGGFKQAGAARESAQLQAESAEQAMRIQTEAQDRALGEQTRQYDLNVGRMQPYMTGGGMAYQDMLRGLGLGSPEGANPMGGFMPEQYGDARVQDLEGQISGLQSQIENFQEPGAQPLGDRFGGMTGMGRNILTGAMDAGRTAAGAGREGGQSLEDLEAQLTDLQGQYEDVMSYREQSSAREPSTGFGEFNEQFQWDPDEDPAVQARLTAGRQLIERSAASRGNLFSGDTLKRLNDYAQEQTAYEYQRSRDRFISDQDRRLGRLSGVSGMGFNAAQQASGFGSQYAANMGNILTSTAANIGDLTTGAGAARAGGEIGASNAWTGAVGNLTNTIGEAVQLSNILGNQQLSGAIPPPQGFEGADPNDIWRNVPQSPLPGAIS